MFFFSTPELLEIGNVPFIIPTMRPTSLDCVNYYRSVAEHFQLQICLYEGVTSVDRSNHHFELKTTRGNVYRCRDLIVATGYYDTPSPLGAPGEDLPHVSHYYRDPLPFYGQKVLIVGGKNSAVEAALDLWRHGAQVTVVHRGTVLSSGVKYWILPDFENRVAAGSIITHFNSTVKEFLPGETVIQTGHTVQSIRNDFVFVLIGYRPDVSFLRSLGIAVDPDSLAPSYNPGTMETNVPNLFVAGGLVGGRFNNKVFIENGRTHGKIIVDAILKSRTTSH
jgi:thioredoxin reductase (NADPH)